MEPLLQDLRYAIRMLLKKPGFTAVVVITLALGIGVNTAIFSVVNGVLLQPLPFKDAHRLVAVREFNPRSFNEPIGASFPDFKDWKEQNKVFQYIAGFTGQSLTLTGEDEPVRVSGQSVSSTFFSAISSSPARNAHARSSVYSSTVPARRRGSSSARTSAMRSTPWKTLSVSRTSAVL